MPESVLTPYVITGLSFFGGLLTTALSEREGRREGRQTRQNNCEERRERRKYRRSMNDAIEKGEPLPAPRVRLDLQPGYWNELRVATGLFICLGLVSWIFTVQDAFENQ